MIVAEISSDREDQQTRTTASTRTSPNVSPVLNHRSRIPAVPARPTSGITVQRNSQGLLRPFDASGNELLVSPSIARNTTPPQGLSAVSPGSESQSLRRKAILDGLGERDAKRVRLQLDGPNSSPLGQDISLDDIPEAAVRNSIVNIRKILPGTKILTARNALIQADYDWEEALTVLCGPEALVAISSDEIESTQLAKKPKPQIKRTLNEPAQSIRDKYSLAHDFQHNKPAQAVTLPEAPVDISGEKIECPPEDQSSANSVTLDNEEPEIFDIDDNPVEVDAYTFFDYDDQVLRCRSCGYEVWASCGFCTGMEKGCCREGLGIYPYFEVLDPEDPEAGPRPAIGKTEYSEETLDDASRRIIVGNYLDDDASAYDSQDAADGHFNEDYDEQDSFIDDDSQPDIDAHDDSSSTDGETDWKEQYDQLRAAHEHLLDDYDNLEDKYDGLKRDFLGSDFESGSDMEERDENGVLVVDVTVPDPAVTELVLSQAEEQSQNSELNSDRIQDRVEASEAASSADGWHNITMVSTQDNHTHPEIEL
jgi:hypothetical protein